MAPGAASTSGLGAGAALLTTDGGRSWSSSPLPGGASTPLAPTEPGDLSLLACSDRANCLLFGGSTVTYSLVGLPSLPRHCPPDGCVLREKATWQPDVASTADGGRGWQMHGATSFYLGSFSWNYTPGEPGYLARATSAAAGPTSACTTSVARVQVTAGSPPRMARSRSYKRPTAVRIGPGNR